MLSTEAMGPIAKNLGANRPKKVKIHKNETTEPNSGVIFILKVKVMTSLLKHPTYCVYQYC